MDVIFVGLAVLAIVFFFGGHLIAICAHPCVMCGKRTDNNTYCTSECAAKSREGQ
jgi:hypothetical protein